jgi:DNA-binding CsgD family transcriptional regulator
MVTVISEMTVTLYKLSPVPLPQPRFVLTLKSFHQEISSQRSARDGGDPPLKEKTAGNRRQPFDIEHVFCYNVVMSIWRHLLSRLGLRIYRLDELLHIELKRLVEQEGRPEDEIVADLIAAGMSHYQLAGELWQHWQSLSWREQQVTGLVCLGYTNPQIAGRLCISPETVKTHLHNALIKFNLHNRPELRMALRKWDFSKWETS